MAHRTVVLAGNPRRVEGKASTGTIYPGMLVELTNASADTFQLRATAGIKAINCVACEDDLQGNDIDTAYTISTRLQAYIPRPGDEIVVRVANGENIAKGDKLVAAAAGYVKEMTLDSSGQAVEEDLLGIAMEAKDMSDSSGADPSDNKIRMRVA